MSVAERIQGLSVSMVTGHGREVRGQELVRPAGLYGVGGIPTCARVVIKR